MRKTEKRRGKRIVTAVTALCLVGMLLPMTALAGDHTSEDYEVFVQAGAGENISKDYENITSQDKGGLWADTEKDGVASISAGEIKVAGEAVKASASDQGDTTVYASSAESTGAAEFGASVSAWDDSKATLYVGNVKANVGIRVDSEGGTAYMEAGDINAFGTENSDLTNNSINASDGGSAVAVLGNVVSGATGINMEATTYGTSENPAIASVEAESITADKTGLSLFSRGSAQTLAGINGDITAGSTGIRSQAMSADSLNAALIYGNVTAVNDGIYIMNRGGQSNIGIGGDVTSTEGRGLFFYGTSPANVLVTGTISGATAGVQVAGNASNLDLTVWQIVSQSRSSLIVVGDDDEMLQLSEDSEDVSMSNDTDVALPPSIHYIVQFEQPAEGATISATKADGSPLDVKYPDGEQGGYEVASAGDKVLLKIDIQEGYVVNGAYNGKDEKIPLLLDGTGNFYVEVPEGGGIYLSVDVALDDSGDGGGIDGGGDSGGKTTPSNIPKTGDSNTTALWITILAFSFLAALAVVIRRLARR